MLGPSGRGRRGIPCWYSPTELQGVEGRDIQRKRWVSLPKAMERVVRQAKAAAVPWMKKEEEGRTMFSKIVVTFVLEAFPGI